MPESPSFPLPVRLLLVDDHPMVREGLRARLSSVPGLQVVGEAADGPQALQQLDLCEPHLVLQDVGLRDGSGIDLVQQMLLRRPLLRVLMFSMYDNAEHVQRALQVGARGYVLKDAPAGEIIGAIEAIMAGGTFLSAALSRRLFRAQQPRPLFSARESEILSALGRGASSKQIAHALHLSVRTVETHRQSIRRKLGLQGQAELIKYAVEHAGPRVAKVSSG